MLQGNAAQRESQAGHLDQVDMSELLIVPQWIGYQPKPVHPAHHQSAH